MIFDSAQYTCLNVDLNNLMASTKIMMTELLMDCTYSTFIVRNVMHMSTLLTRKTFCFGHVLQVKRNLQDL